MKCGNCKLWKHNVQDGMTIKNKKKEFKLFGKALGFCNCNRGGNYPMFNYEQCPLTNYKCKESRTLNFNQTSTIKKLFDMSDWLMMEYISKLPLNKNIKIQLGIVKDLNLYIFSNDKINFTFKREKLYLQELDLLFELLGLRKTPFGLTEL